MQLNKANSFDTQASLMDFNISLSNGTFSTKIYYKRDNFDFDIVNFPVFDCDVPRRTLYGVLESYIFNLFVSLKHLLTL